MDAWRIQEHFVAVMAKHLPPSASTLRLLDLDGRSGSMLSQWRADLEIHHIPPRRLGQSGIPPKPCDAVVAYDIELSAPLLHSVLDLLRPGGRLIALHSRGIVSDCHPQFLRDNGYVRILVEPALDKLGVLLRGEKPHVTADTAKRIRSVAQADMDSLDLDHYKGRYLHLLIQQRPNKPAWKLTKSETISWRAAAIKRGSQTVMLAFSSLPKAVGFMQPAVLARLVQDINKVGKFSRATATDWTWEVILNPTLDSIRDNAIAYVDLDPSTAEAPDE